MTSIITSVKDLITSVFEVIFSVVKGAVDTVYQLFVAFVDFFAGIPKMIQHLVKGTLEATGGVGAFITSRFLRLTPRGFNQLTIARQHRRYKSDCIGQLWLYGLFKT